MLQWFGASACRIGMRNTALPCSVGSADVVVPSAWICSIASCFSFAENYFMENPFEMIIEKLNSIEALLKSMSRVENGNVTVTEILNVDEAAKYLSVTKSHIYKQTSQNEIPHYKRGKKIYFKRSELYEWLTNNRITTKEEIDRMATEYILPNPSKRRR